MLNYHLYNGAALLGGRFKADLLAAGMQGYLNPVLDAVYAGLALGPWQNHPRWLAGFMGLWFGAAIYFAARLAALIYGHGRLPAIVAVALGITGAAVVSQIGSTTDDLPVGAVMLAGLYLLLRDASTKPPSSRGLVAGAAMFGVAAGLKLTATVYALAAGLAVLSLHRPRQMLRAAFLFGAGWIAGFAISDGWWALRLYDRFGNPTFPMFNGVFRSLWYPPASVIDDRFLPHGILQWLFYPLYWIGGDRLPGELPFRDPRGAILLCLGLAVLLMSAARRVVARTSDREPGFSPIQRAVLVFLAAGYVAWLTTSSILRYAVILEIVAGLSIPLLLMRILHGRAAIGGLVLVLGLTVAATRYPEPARVPYADQTLRADMGWVEPGMLIVLTFRGPVSHLVALMPPRAGVQVINVGNTVLEARGWKLHDEMARLVKDHAGRIVVLTQGHPAGRFPELGEIGLDPELANCRPVGSGFDGPGGPVVSACDARREEPRRLISRFWAQAATRYRTVVQLSGPAQTLIGEAYLRAAGPGARGTRFIDWTDLLWSGVGRPHDSLPPNLDPGTLYVLAPEFALAAAARIDPAADGFGRVDGILVAAPGWHRCSACTAPIDPLSSRDGGQVLSIGDVRVLGPQARASGYLADGWWPQDEGSVWSQSQAEMILPLAADLPETSTLVIKGVAFTGPGLPIQRVGMEVVGQSAPLAWQNLDGEGFVRLRLNRAWLRRNADGRYILRLRLSFPDAASPAQLGMSIDPRALGFSPSSVGLEGM